MMLGYGKKTEQNKIIMSLLLREVKNFKMHHGRILILLLTSFSLNVSLPSFPESNHGSEKSSENCPSENSYRINSNHPRDKCIFATSQKSYNVRAHMICIFFPEILHEKSTSVIFEKVIKPRR